MGMGEPLQNYDAVMDAVRGMTDVKRFRLSHHQVTISTVGIVHAIKRMTADFPQLNLALSLHAPSQALRQQIVPSAKAFPIEKLLAVCLEHTRVSKKPLFVEYVLLKGVNDRPEHARELGQLLVGASVIVNLIPYNPTDVAMDFETPEDDDVDAFYTVLAHDYKLLTTVRVHHGREIGGACGQLALTQPGKGESAGPKGAPAVNDIEDLMDGGGRRGAKKGERPWGKNRGGGGAAGRKVARAALGGDKLPHEKGAIGGVPSQVGKGQDSRDREGKAEDQDGRGVSRRGMPAHVSCGRATWILSLAGACVAMAAGLVLLRVGLTVWVVQERHGSKR